MNPSAVALKRIEDLLECGAAVTVVAPNAIDAVLSLAQRGEIRLNLREYDLDDLDDKFAFPDGRG
jgi:siroheme synthase (precorrin-2 oxidase/ferrochelatase)